MGLAGPAAGETVRGVNLSCGPPHVLKDISLEVKAGAFFAFLGPTGCGKPRSCA